MEKVFCTQCKTWKLKTNFSNCEFYFRQVRFLHKMALAGRCLSCRNIKKRLRASTDSGRLKNKKYNLKTKFGISLDDFTNMKLAQNGLCAICLKEEKGFMKGRPKNLSVDHCHNTGKIRGLLCSACNGGIGHFYENVTNLKRAIEYLERYKNDSNDR